MKYQKICAFTFPTALVLLIVALLSVSRCAHLLLKMESETVDIHITRSERFQTMEGFGGYGAQDVWWHSPPHFDQAFVDMLINDLGLTILRDSVPFGFLSGNENDFDNVRQDPLKIDMNSHISGDEASPSEHFAYLKAMHEAGLQKLIVSIWSPPPWMKNNGKLSNGSERTNSAPAFTRQADASTNQLKLEKYSEFADFCIAYIKLLKIKTGIDLYAISLQNEPRFSQFYASAVYDPASMAMLIRIVGDRFRKENIATKIFAPEDVNIPAVVTPFINAITQSRQANEYVTAFAVHDYQADGIQPQADSIKRWKSLAKLSSAANKAVWMTETSGYENDSITSGIALARSIHNAIKFGNAAVWLYWQMSAPENGTLIKHGQPTILYHISKQFYRFIRPGFVRLAATSSAPEILVLAFSSPTDDTITAVLINTSKDSRPVQIAGNIYACKLVITTNNAEKYKTLTPTLETTQMIVSGLSVTSLGGCKYK